jgi:glycosyltransferase involved in cell wall biosynthesis
MYSGVTVVIPSLATRGGYLQECVDSVLGQTLTPEALIVEVDHERNGAWVTRNKAMMKVTSEWTAFIDDDDKMLPHHLEFLRRCADEDELDLCWGWFEVIGGTDPFPKHRGRQYNPEKPHIFPIPVLVRTSFLHSAYEEMGGFQPDSSGSWLGQDHPLWKHVISTQGARHKAYSETTWVWRHHSSNTSGLPSKGN